MTDSQGKTKRTGSVVGSVASVESKVKQKSFPLWPEFNENEVNSEKWEGAGKSKEKGKSPNMHFFEDPEGKIEFPNSFKIDHWKRPHDFLVSKVPVVVDNENYMNIMMPNEHLLFSQLMRTIISQMMALWEISREKPLKPENSEPNPWLPWDHIYSLCKAGKGHIPMFNSFGKYIVRLYWMGAWRKILVDDQMPFDVNDKLLLPASTAECELWPMLLSKAIIKIATLDYNLTSDVPEIGDFFVIQCLTGWVPECIPLQNSHNKSVWELLKKVLPEWTLPKFDEKDKASTNGDPDLNANSTVTGKNDPPKHGALSGIKAEAKHEKGSGKDAKAGKESSRKRDDKEKNKSVTEESIPPRPEDVQMLVFATFNQSHTSPAPMSLLRDMARSSENLRKLGFSHFHTHPVHVSQTRSCPLIPPTPVPEVPRWKLIRPHKKKIPPSDEPLPEPIPPKPDQWVEVVSPYLGYRPPCTATGQRVPSVSGGSVVLNELDEDAPLESKKNKSHSAKSNNAATLKSATVDTPTNQRLPSPMIQIKGESNDDETVNRTEDDAEENEEQQEEDGEEQLVNDDVDLLKKSWIDFDEFCKSFTNVVIFHKPLTYPHTEAMTEIKQTAFNSNPTTTQPSGKKGSANQATSNTNIRPGQSPIVPKSYEGFPLEERNPGFLFVDSSSQTELVVSYTVIPRWLGLEEKKVSDRESVAAPSEAVSLKQDPLTVPSGLLVVEQFSWKSLVTGQSVLRIRTTGTRAACLTLPPGRHVLRFIYNSPLGFHVRVCSTTKFMFGDEDTVMTPLREESCRFVEVATEIMSCVDKCLETFGSEAEFTIASNNLHKAHMPYAPENKQQLMEHYKQAINLNKKSEKGNHSYLCYTANWIKRQGDLDVVLACRVAEVWRKAFYSTIVTATGDAKMADLVFALRAFLLDLDTCGIYSGESENKERETIVESWQDRIPTDEESNAACTIQKTWRGSYAKRVVRSRIDCESREQKTVLDVLKAVRNSLHNNIHAHSITLLRNMIRFKPQLATKFPFYKDEWNKIAFTDYHGTYTEQPAKTWFVVFREVFYVEKEVLCVPKAHVGLHTAVLRVINNDTGEELKKVFHKVSPHVFTKNKRGYTFVVEARTLDQPLNPGKWKLRLIGSSDPLPSPISSQITSTFNVKEVKDYYVPNSSHSLLRYALKCNTNIVGTLQLQTSKPDAIIHFKVFDNDIELASVRGKGHCVIPAVYFQTNNKERTGSGASNHDNRGTGGGSGGGLPTNQSKGAGKKAASARKDGKSSPVPSKEKKQEHHDVRAILDDIDDDNNHDHHYIIQAFVERKTWPLTRSQWSFVEKQKEAEREEMKAFSGGQRQTLTQKPGAPAEKGKKGSKAGAEKGGKEKKQADKEIGSRPSSQSLLDESRPFWLLRLIVDGESGEDVEIKKDTQRQEELRAMKQAWESAEPGRAVKAMQARLNYLNSNSSKPSDSSDKENEEEVEKAELAEVSSEPNLVKDTELFFLPPEPLTPKETTRAFDESLHIKDENATPQFIDPADLALLEEEEQRQKTEEYNLRREKSQAFRENNRNERLVLKEQQLEACKEMQHDMDRARTDLLKPREAFRQRLLDEKRRMEEEAEAQAAAALAASEAASPDGKGKKSAKKKK